MSLAPSLRLGLQLLARPQESHESLVDLIDLFLVEVVILILGLFIMLLCMIFFMLVLALILMIIFRIILAVVLVQVVVLVLLEVLLVLGIGLMSDMSSEVASVVALPLALALAALPVVLNPVGAEERSAVVVLVRIPPGDAQRRPDLVQIVDIVARSEHLPLFLMAESASTQDSDSQVLI